MNIYDFLASRQKKTPFANSVEMAFFKKHAGVSPTEYRTGLRSPL